MSKWWPLKRTENPLLVQKLVDGLSRRQETGRTGIHVSDLVLCLRRAYYSKVSPRQPTVETLSYFVDGSRRDLVIKGLLGTRVGPMEKDGIWFTPDSVDEAGDPIEIKTTRAAEGVSAHYVTQLTYYMVLMKRNRGRLLIQRVGYKRVGPPFEAYEFEFEGGEIQRHRREMLERRDLFSKALDQRDPTLVPSVRSDPAQNWLCRGCRWNEECEVIDLQRSVRNDKS